MDLQNPNKKMDKSADNNKGCIFYLNLLIVFEKKSKVLSQIQKASFDMMSKTNQVLVI